ncbi:hypothetical protein L6452_42238 [Arctium lappa]|uniref:Uncharacterized protein n=1 Tax=Arctium lappa TaxID=4217 RepID=A0ACB8XHQ2_ARCLA|nr:hypothetical protein L6452_42238 [Arctium lappa]
MVRTLWQVRSKSDSTEYIEVYGSLFKDKGCDIGINNSDQQKDDVIELGDQEKDKGIKVGQQQKDKGIELGDQEQGKSIEVGDQQKDRVIELGDQHIDKGIEVGDQEQGKSIEVDYEHYNALFDELENHGVFAQDFNPFSDDEDDFDRNDNVEKVILKRVMTVITL